MNVTGVTIILPIQGGSSGQIVFQDCASLSADVVVILSQGGALPAPGSSLEIVAAEQGNCSSLQLNQTVTIQGGEDGCSKLIGTTQQSEFGGKKSISMLFSVDSSGCGAPGSSPSSDSIIGGSPVGPIVGGVVGGVAAIAVILGLTLFLVKRRNERIARQDLRNKMAGL